MTFPVETPVSRAARHRALALAVVMWAFGLATTTLLVGLWGRSVATDQTALSESAAAMLGADMVSERVFSWLDEALGVATSAAGPEVEGAIASVAASPVAEEAVDQIVHGFVAAAVAPPGTEVRIDVAGAAEPLLPLLRDEFEARGVVIPTQELDAAVDRIATVVLETEQSLGVAGSVYRAKSALTTVLVVGIAALTLFGSLALALTDDREKMVRTLATRLAVSAGTFVVFLKVGAWAVDPAGGRSPIADGGAVLLGSNHLTLLVVAGAATAVAATAGLSVRRRRIRSSVAVSSEETEDTGERELLLV